MKKALFFILVIYNCSYSQSFDPKVLEHIDEFFIDAVFYADQFITPATDAAVYQSSGGWIFSAKKEKRWSTTFGVHSNVFFVPNSDRTFVLNDSDFTFLLFPFGVLKDQKYFLPIYLRLVVGHSIRYTKPK